MFKRVLSSKKGRIAIALAGVILLAVFVYRIPRVNSAIAWRMDKFGVYVRNLINPIGPVPTALPVTPQPATPTNLPTQTAVAIVQPIATSTPTSVPLPPQVSLASPPYEQQTPNNCGPATLSMALHMFGWEGSQEVIADVIKPVLQDRNVNPEELRYFVRNEAGWLNLEYRVGGDIDLLKRLLAANYPVIIEGTTSLDPNDALGSNDDLWAAHYLLLTGYDDATQTFTVQDSYHGADQQVAYSQLETDWKPFNYLYLIIYLPQQEQEIKDLLASNWDPNLNRQIELDATRAETVNDPSDAFAWFNYGSNLVYFDRYEEAAQAFDKAREIGLPLRMFRYQFSPFIAYFQSGRVDDLLILTDYARGVTEMSEEAWLWYGWGLYSQGDFDGALKAWNKAIAINPSSYVDARLALQYVQ
ncbi:MAG: C39 family peptidase [Chloroflexi bacterium]|nr:C39 family peptidase [Chloroflexota bacterium]